MPHATPLTLERDSDSLLGNTYKREMAHKVESIKEEIEELKKKLALLGTYEHV